MCVMIWCASLSHCLQGRVNCTGMVLDISLLKRHDCIFRVIDALAFPYHDKVTIQVRGWEGGGMCVGCVYLLSRCSC